ncbi:MAG: hypothetical protein ACTSPA_07215 [Promethearchaeota archaeon]
MGSNPPNLKGPYSNNKTGWRTPDGPKNSPNKYPKKVEAIPHSVNTL